MGAGDLFGELAIFDKEARSATAECVEPTQVVALTSGDVASPRRACSTAPAPHEIGATRSAAMAHSVEALAPRSSGTVSAATPAKPTASEAASRRDGQRRSRMASITDVQIGMAPMSSAA
ncbi:hypothetical protein DCC79_06920 [bacterium]|nr:MAG: hypothetical protein DCC79_06920 [bacterium]